MPVLSIIFFKRIFFILYLIQMYSKSKACQQPLIFVISPAVIKDCFCSLCFRQAGELMTGGTKRCLSVSTLAEAEFYADGGFDDITYAYPLSPDKVPQAAQLLIRLQNFHVLIDNHVVLDSLVANQPPQGKRWSVFLKVNCGYNRGNSF